jgi:DinB superfamily
MLEAGSPFPWRYDDTQWGSASEQIRQACDAAAQLLRTSADVRHHRAAGRWSSLEYACHVRDVLLVQRERVLKAMRGHGDEPFRMGRDERVHDDGYNEQGPLDVAVHLEQSAILFTGLLDRLTPGDWDLELDYPFPESAMRKLRWVAVHTAHEVIHHLHDMHAST